MFVYGDYEVPTPSDQQSAQQYDTEKDNPSEWVKKYSENKPWLVQVSQSYICDNFNLWGLSSEFDHYAIALKIIKGNEVNVEEEEREEVDEEVEKLYNLIHQRFLLTFNGVRLLQKKYLAEVYGKCPRVSCHHAKLLPIGLSPNYGEQKVKLYCTCCKEIYDAGEGSEKYDGAAFGPYCPTFFQEALMCEFPFPKCVETELSILGIKIEPGDKMNRSGIIHPSDK